MPTLGLENTYAEQLDGLYVPHTPQGFPNPVMVELNRSLVAELGLDEALLDAQGAALLSGTRVPDDSRPLAQAYAGHQFGGFSPQLGDGRAVLLGEIVDVHGHRRDLHLKGSGRTAFSRGGDGKATLGPVLREYLVGEAMHHLGIPTTRVLAALTTGETVHRSEPLPGAVLARIAASHLRVGTLEFFAVRQDHAKLARVVDYALARHYPDATGTPAVALLRAVAEAQGRLIASWMNVGFIHGVMNTDNCTLSGETLDYGPCAFLDRYDPSTVFSSIDHGGRYAYGNQPGIAQWNLARMGEALLPLIADDEEEAVEHVQEALRLYARTYQDALVAGLLAKLGCAGSHPDDPALLSDFLGWMESTRQDFTGTFRALSAGLRSGQPAFDDAAFLAWSSRWHARLEGDPMERADRMDEVNPVYVPRNHLVEEALDAAVAGDLGPFRSMLAVLERPYTARDGLERYASPAPPAFEETYQTFCGT
ncbi:MAG: YdiU family protein [Myxococcota bacterium]